MSIHDIRNGQSRCKHILRYTAVHNDDNARTEKRDTLKAESEKNETTECTFCPQTNKKLPKGIQKPTIKFRERSQRWCKAHDESLKRSRVFLSEIIKPHFLPQIGKQRKTRSGWLYICSKNKCHRRCVSIYEWNSCKDYPRKIHCILQAKYQMGS